MSASDKRPWFLPFKVGGRAYKWQHYKNWRLIEKTEWRANFSLLKLMLFCGPHKTALYPRVRSDTDTDRSIHFRTLNRGVMTSDVSRKRGRGGVCLRRHLAKFL